MCGSKYYLFILICLHVNRNKKTPIIHDQFTNNIHFPVPFSLTIIKIKVPPTLSPVTLELPHPVKYAHILSVE